MKHPIIFGVALLLVASSAQAQETSFTPDDDAVLSKCMASVQDAVSQTPDAPVLPSGNADNPHLPADCIGAASSICMDTPDGSTTVGMSQCMGRETDWWDTLLNANYQDLREALDDESFAALQTAQKHWIAFRDADCQYQYTRWREGTIRSTYFASCMLDATATRAITLGVYRDEGSY